MSECYLLFKGWDDHDSSPRLEKVFGTYEKALAHAKELEDADMKRHMASYGDQPGCSACWHEVPDGDRCYRSREFIRFGLSPEDIAVDYVDNGELSSETIYIEKHEIN